jgi:uncharacterized protein (DUF58 family)
VETSELLKKVRKIELKTKGLSNNIFSGSYHSAFKGRGMTFSEFREYQAGDDVRAIGWNVTARFNHPYVKVYEEERELTVILLVDVSGSGNFGTQTDLKKNIITEICAVLSFSAMQNNDKIGIIFFSDKIEKFIPPKKGKSHILRIIRELIEFKPENTQTNIGEALKYLTGVIKKRCIVFVMSDFFDSNDYTAALKIANKKHDVVGLQIFDKTETQLPNVGMLHLKDAETGERIWVDTSNKNIRSAFEKYNKERFMKIEENFRKCRVDFAHIPTHQSYIQPIQQLFKRREA